MGQPISQYVEQKIDFGKAPQTGPKPGEFWTFVEDGKVMAVNFICPCGCGHECYTPVTLENEPKQDRHWVYSAGPTLTPSIRYLSGCKAHFNITNGKPVMHADSGKGANP